MAMNPPLSFDGTPIGMVGETYFLQRSGVTLQMDTTGGKLKAGGRIFLTSLRLCFVPHAPVAFAGGVVAAVDLPLQGISKEDFKLPILGANYLQGVIAPVPGRGLTAPTQWYVTFNDGGCGTFLNVFWPVMGAIKDAAVRDRFFANASSFIAEQAAYVDPSDTSVLYITQPATQFAPTPTVGAYGGVPAPGYVPAAPHSGYAPPAAAAPVGVHAGAAMIGMGAVAGMMPVGVRSAGVSGGGAPTAAVPYMRPR